MSFPISSLIGRLRNRIDLVVPNKDVLPQDGTLYIVPLSKSPILSGSDEVYITHVTFTTGFYQFVPRNGTQSSAYSSGFNLTYTVNPNRGELAFYQGSGTVVGSGLNPFAPWNTSNVIAYYDYSKYTDSVLANYLSYAVASVEASLQMGIYVSGINGVVPPLSRISTDVISYLGAAPYSPSEIFVISEDLEIIQELISQKAAIDLITRERRIGTGNAIKIVDGDTQIDTSVNQRYLADFVKDLRKEYDTMIKTVVMGMLDGYNIKQIDEMYGSVFAKMRFQYISDY